MTKSRSVALAAHQELGTTTLAMCWKVTRRDTQVFGFTSVDISFAYDGVVYEAATGFTPSAIDGRSDLSVPNMEVTGVLDSASITEQDLLSGVWDGAEVEIFEINYRDTSQGRMQMSSGTIGDVSAGRSTFRAELRGLTQKLQQNVGEVFTAACPANLGDARCQVDLGPLTVTGTLTAVASAREFTDSSRSEADDYFGGGLITWTGGANTGLSMEIRYFSAGVFELSLPMPLTVAIGDTYSLVPGCRKRLLEDCKAKFNNVVNFRGHPWVPGNDKVLGNGALAEV